MFTDYVDERPLHEIEGLTAYLRSSINPPARLTLSDYTTLSITKRAEYDAARDRHLSGNIIIKTPQVSAAMSAVGTMIRKNDRRADTVRPGLIISGDGSMGKTTIAKTLMREVFNEYQKQFPDFEKDGRHPVVYVEVPAGSTGKLLLVAFARCLGLTIASRETQDTLMVRVSNALRSARTQLIVVDELQNLSAANRGNGESIQILRQLHSWVPAIFVFAGINLRTGQLFSGPAGRQLSGRFTLHELDRFTLASTKERGLWQAIIREFEKELMLFAHAPGMLAPVSAELHDLTGGSIATLGRLLTGTARDLIDKRSPADETMTIETVAKQPRDMAADHHHHFTTTRKAKTTKKGA